MRENIIKVAEELGFIKRSTSSSIYEFNGNSNHDDWMAIHYDCVFLLNFY